MRFIDICAGIGGFRSGLEQAGHECIGYVEVDKYARKSYEAMYNTENEWTETDITKVKSEDIPRADLWCFGFPCQDISISGRQKGLRGERSGIFYSIIKLLKSQNTENKPGWLLIENVKNLLSIHGGQDFTEVLSEISEAGYDTEWALLNSKDFGVPQNRERVFIVGHLRERGRRQVLSKTGSDRQTGGEIGNEIEIKSLNVPQHNGNFIQSYDGLSRSVLARDYKDPQKIAVPKINTIMNSNRQSERIYGIDGISRVLTSAEGGGIGNGVRTGLYALPKQIISGSQAHRVYDSEGLSVTVKAEGGGVGAKTGLYAIPKIKTIATGINQRENIQEYSGLARSLTATDYKEPQSVAIPHKKEYGIFEYEGKEYNIRRLTPKECFRLQGFTDEQFEKAQAVNSNTQLYKQAGNAVTVNVARYLGELLQKAS